MPDLNKQALEDQLNKYKDDKKLYDFFNKKINDCSKDNNLYANRELTSYSHLLCSFWIYKYNLEQFFSSFIISEYIFF